MNNQLTDKEKRVYAAEVVQWVKKTKLVALVGIGGSMFLPFLYDAFNTFFYLGLGVVCIGLGWFYVEAIKKQKYLAEKYQV